MGQKVNPVGFRLGTSRDHDSVWFAKSKDYSKLDEVSERYITQNPEVLGNLQISHGEAQLNNSYAVLLPRIYSDTLDIHFLEDCIDSIILAKNIDAKC